MSAETFVATFGRFSTSWDLSAQMYDADGVAVGDALTDWQELGGGRYMLYAEDVPSSARVIVVSESTYGVVQVGPVEVSIAHVFVPPFRSTQINRRILRADSLSQRSVSSRYIRRRSLE